jgi:hypothetical protein
MYLLKYVKLLGIAPEGSKHVVDYSQLGVSPQEQYILLVLGFRCIRKIAKRDY